MSDTVDPKGSWMWAMSSVVSLWVWGLAAAAMWPLTTYTEGNTLRVLAFALASCVHLLIIPVFVFSIVATIKTRTLGSRTVATLHLGLAFLLTPPALVVTLVCAGAAVMGILLGERSLLGGWH